MTDASFTRPHVKLPFDSPDLAGLEVWVQRMSARQYATIRDDDAESLAEREERIIATVARCLRRWNLVNEDGDREPCDVEALMRLDKGLLGAITDALVDVSTSVSPPLSGRSKSGSDAPAPDVPMEVLSPNPLS